MPSRRLTLEQAAEFLKLPPNELRSLAVQNLINYSQQGERYFFTQDDLDEWVSRKIIALQSMKPSAQHRERKTLKIPDTSRPFLSELCTIDTVSCQLTGKSRPSVLKELAELAVSSGYVYDPNDLYVELLEREEIASTAIEQGAAIPHPHHRFDIPIFEESFICVAKTTTPVFFGNSPDGLKTDIFFLICCMDSNLHIQTIARICQLCIETSLLNDLRSATTNEELLNTLLEIDAHPEQHPLKKLQIEDEA